MGRPLRGGPGAWTGGAIASAARPRPDNGRRAAAGDYGAAPRASALGTQETAGDVDGAGAGRRVASCEHDGRSVATGGPEPAAAARTICRAVDAAVGGRPPVASGRLVAETRHSVGSH